MLFPYTKVAPGMNFLELQVEVARWWQFHGPAARPHDVLMALYNEVGVLNEHCRKHPCPCEEDAMGMIILLLVEYCNLKGIQLQDVVERAWEAERRG